MINWSRAISNSLVNEVRLGVNYLLTETGANPDSKLGNLGETLGIANANAGGPGLLALNFNGPGYISSIGNSNSGASQLFASTVINFDDSLTYTRGHHVIKAGFQLLRERIDIYYASNSGNLGNIGFSGGFSGSNETDFFLGLPQSFGKGGGLSGTWGQRANVISGFINDDWRVSDSLTVNAGLRYENHTPWVEVANRQVNFDLQTGKMYTAGQSCPYSNCNALYNSYNLGYDFQPRVGFAFSPAAFRHKTVLRGAYGTSTYMEGTGTNLRLTMNPPLNGAETASSYAAGPNLLPPTNLSQGLILPPAGDPFAGATLRLWAPDIKPALIQQWSLTLQHQFSNSTTLQAGYVGQKGTHLVVPIQAEEGDFNASTGVVTPSQYLGGPSNAIYADTVGKGGFLKETATIGKQDYQSLQVVFQKRMSQGLEGQVSYTFSKCMTDSSGYYGTWAGSYSGFGAATYWQNIYNQGSEWGPCFFDQKHTISANAIYQIPFGVGRAHGAHLNKAVNAVVGNWNLSSIVSIRTGMPNTAFTWWSPFENTAGLDPLWGSRLNCVAPVKYNLQPYATGGLQWFNNGPSTDSGTYFSNPTTNWGNCGNSTIYGKGSGDIDLALQKDFVISETKKVQLRSDFINATNSKLLNAPAATGLGPTMGTITSTQFPRLITLALKFYF